MDTINMALKLARIREELTQYELAERAGLTQTLVSLAETGRKILKPGEAAKIAKALGLNAKKIFGNIVEETE